MKKYTISIPVPCTVPLQNMTTIPGGRFCSSCQKQVVDFTGMTDQQMIAYFKTHSNGCGSFLPSQLNKDIPDKAKQKWMPAAILATLLAIVMPEQGKAQMRKVTGIVKDSASGQPLPGTQVNLIGTGTNVFSKEDGSFIMPIPENYGDSIKLKMLFIGFKTKEISLPKDETEQPIQVKLELQETSLEDVVLVGAYLGNRTTWWQRVKRKILR